MLVRRPALDGLRGVAVLLVVMAHAHVPGVEAAGGVGVCVFFVLSGYLITGLLLTEHAASGRVRFRAFYIRRARRLLPALGLLLTFLISLRALTGMADVADTRAVVGAVFYVNNWQVGHHNLTTLLHTWSLSVEEQFYSIWPMVLLLCLRRGGRTLASRVAAGTIGALLCVVGIYVAADASLYSYTSLTGFAAVLTGSLLALRPMWLRSWLISLAVLLLAAGSFATGSVLVLGQLAGVVAGVLAISATSTSAYRGWLTTRAITYVGRRSYAIYLWHYPLLLMARGAPEESRWLVRALLVVSTFPIAELSWRFVERPILHGGRSADLVHREGAPGEVEILRAPGPLVIASLDVVTDR
jgi:peptidoglycan/LPS O-acetylase OafA/YrhL